MRTALLSTAAFLTAISTALVATTTPVSANTVKYPSVHAEINSVNYPAVAVGDSTYLLWAAMEKFHTPYRYDGHGNFNIAGREVTGTIYRGQVYLPWWVVGGTGVKATRIPGGWNFTHVWSDTTDDGYKLNVITQTSAEPGQEVPLWVQTFTANGKVVPNQQIQIKESSDIPGYGGGGASDSDESSGMYYWPQCLFKEGNDFVDVSWTDPNRVLHTLRETIRFAYPPSTDTPIPGDDQVVAQTPIHVINDCVLFDGLVNGQAIHWQLDTGAMTPLLNGADAAHLNLPNLGTLTIQGVTGQDTAYWSKMNVTIGGVTFNDVQCVVYPNMQGNSLFGYSFFSDQKYDLLISEKHNTLSILR